MSTVSKTYTPQLLSSPTPYKGQNTRVKAFCSNFVPVSFVDMVATSCKPSHPLRNTFLSYSHLPTSSSSVVPLLGGASAYPMCDPSFLSIVQLVRLVSCYAHITSRVEDRTRTRTERVFSARLYRIRSYTSIWPMPTSSTTTSRYHIQNTESRSLHSD